MSSLLSRPRFGLPPLPERLPFARQVAAEIERVADTLMADRQVILTYWNQMRVREPLMEILVVGWREHTAAALLDLTLPQLDVADAFYDELDQLRTWARHTEVMPATLERKLDRAIERLTPLAADAIAVLADRDPVWETRPDPWEARTTV